jgi:hypothetical protein
MLRNNHLSLLPIDFKVMIREDLGNLLGEILTREGQPCNAARADEPINENQAAFRTAFRMERGRQSRGTLDGIGEKS